MKKIRKILFILLIIISFIFWIIKVFWEQNDITICSWKDWFERYKCQVKNICKKQDFWRNTAKIVALEKVFEKNTSIKEAQDIYSYNQNQIYKCWILESQRKVFEELIEKLVKTTDKSWIIKTKVIPKIKQKLERIKSIKTKNKCQFVEKKKTKKIVLDQSSLELCKYNYFLHYLYKDKKDNFSEEMFDWEQSISFEKAENYIEEQRRTINYNLRNSIKIYNTAYRTYTQYDDFLKTHIMMDLLKEDYKAFRDSLYQMLHPINQTIYKVINAQNP